jgi:hypothetical protein
MMNYKFEDRSFPEKDYIKNKIELINREDIRIQNLIEEDSEFKIMEE